MKPVRYKTLGLTILLLLAGWETTAGQTPRSHGRITTRIQYYRWTVKDSLGNGTLSQATVPINGLLAPNANSEVRFSLTGSTNRYDSPRGEPLTLDGIGDVRVQGTRMFRDRGLVLSGGINFPTGKRQLNYQADTTIVNLLSRNYLFFPQRRFGRGWGFNGLLGVAHVVGYSRLSAGFMFEYAGKYSPYETLKEYDPGEVFSLSFSFDWQHGRLILFADLLGSAFSWDKYDGEDAIKQSPQLTIRVGGVRRIGNNETGVSMRAVFRGNHQLATSDSTAIETKLYGNELHVTGYFRHNYSGGLHIAPTFEIRFVDGNSAENDLAQGESLLFGVGSGIGQRLSDQLQLVLDGRYFFGKADSDNLDLAGFQVTASLTSTF